MKTGSAAALRWAWAFGLALGLVPVCFAETIRLTTWDLPTPAVAPASGAAEDQIRQAAAALKKLNPDVILLRQVRGWQMCGQLAQALKPADYSVLVCSSFRGAQTGTPGSEQVAILSKRRAYFSWSESWRPEGETALAGGFAFAAIQFGQQRVGFFSVRADDRLLPGVGGGESSAASPVRDASARQWLLAVESFRNWMTNRVGAVVVAGGFNSTSGRQPPRSGEMVSVLQEAVCFAAFVGAPLDRPVTLPAQSGRSDAAGDCIRAALAANPDSWPGVILERSTVTCDLEILGAKTVAMPVANADGAHNLGREEVNAPAPPSEARGSLPEGQSRASAAPRPEVQVASLPHSSPTAASAAGNYPLSRAVTFAGLASLVVLTWIVAKLRATNLPGASVLLPGQVERSGSAASSYTLVVTPGPGADSRSGDAELPPASRLAVRVETADTTRTQSKSLPQRMMPAWQQAGQDSPLRHPWLIQHLSQWLKQRLVQKLLLDRAQLLRTQQAATLKMMNVDERLTRIELQMQQQNQAYERRIEELNRELLAAKAENRELIRARIVEVQAEMEVARAKAVAQAQGENRL